MSGHIKWNRVGRFGISSMLLLIIMGCGHNMRDVYKRQDPEEDLEEFSADLEEAFGKAIAFQSLFE